MRIALIENGAGMGAGPARDTWTTRYRKMPQELPEHPSETFKRNFWMHPFHEEDPHQLVELARRRPRHLRVGLPPRRGPGRSAVVTSTSSQGLPDEEMRKIMGGNMIGLLGLSAGT